METSSTIPRLEERSGIFVDGSQEKKIALIRLVRKSCHRTEYKKRRKGKKSNWKERGGAEIASKD
jgi:hypothetical protein